MPVRSKSSASVEVEKKRSPERKFKVGGRALMESLQQTWNGHLPDGFTEWLEAHTYEVKRGAPKKVSRESTRIELCALAIVVDAIRRERLQGMWSATAVAKYLKEKHPDRAEYRHLKLGALIKRVERLAKQIGPMDDEAICRARAIFGGPHS